MFLAVPLLLRVYGAGEYGVYSQVWVIASAFSGLGVGWLRQAELRYTGDPTLSLLGVRRIVLFGTALASGLLAAFLSVVLLTSAQDWSIRVAAGALTAAMSYYSLRLVRAQRLAMMRVFNLAEITRASLGVLLALSLPTWILPNALWLPRTASLIVAVFACGYLMASMVLPPVFRPLRLRSDATRAFLAYGWPMGLWLPLSTGMLYVDRMLLGGRVGEDALGNYAAASDIIVRGMTLIGAPFLLYFHPKIMNLLNTGRAKNASTLLSKWEKVGALGCLLVVVLAWFYVTPFANFLGITGVPREALVLLVAGGSLWQLAQVTHKPLEMRGQTWVMLVALSLAFGLQLALLTILIPPLGLVGAALGMASGPFAYILITSLAARQPFPRQVETSQ